MKNQVLVTLVVTFINVNAPFPPIVNIFILLFMHCSCSNSSPNGVVFFLFYESSSHFHVVFMLLMFSWDLWSHPFLLALSSCYSHYAFVVCVIFIVHVIVMLIILSI
jgi:hypothetical protein